MEDINVRHNESYANLALNPLLWLLAILCLYLVAGCSTAGTEFAGLGNFAWVVEGKLARSDQPDNPLGYETLKAMGFKSVWNFDTQDEWAAVSDHKMTPYWLPMSYLSPFTTSEIQTIIEILQHPWNEPALIHCKRGADRTGLIAGSYRIIVQKWTFTQAYTEMKTYIPEGHEFWPKIKEQLHAVAAAYGRDK